MEFTPKVSSTFSLYARMLLAFGLVFQMPTVVLALARMGVVTAGFLARHTKYAILIIFIIAAVITPTSDVVTQALMAAPMIVLYAISIVGRVDFRTQGNRSLVIDIAVAIRASASLEVRRLIGDLEGDDAVRRDAAIARLAVIGTRAVRQILEHLAAASIAGHQGPAAAGAGIHPRPARRRASARGAGFRRCRRASGGNPGGPGPAVAAAGHHACSTG